MTRARTVIQISDLHIARSLVGGGWIPKAHGHDLSIVQGLSNWLSRYRTNRADALIVSGDATAKGSNGEFAAYSTLRDCGWAVDSYTQYDSLQAVAKNCADLPGNHDYWRGLVLNPTIRPDKTIGYFRRDAWPLRLNLGAHAVVLHELCTTAGAKHKEQVLAVGRCRAVDLRRLHAALADAAKDVQQGGLTPIQLVVIHHSTMRGSPRMHGLAKNTLAALSSLQGKPHDVRGLMSGHTHRFSFGRGPAGLEACCPTTTQGNFATTQQQGFLRHTFVEGGGRVNWRITRFHWDGATFVRGATINQPL